MNYLDLENTVKHLKKTSKCLSCKAKYELEDIHIVATTAFEGLFEMKCFKCHKSTIVTVVLTPPQNTKNGKKEAKETILESYAREHRILNRGKKISDNDILDMKIFLNKFDGNFNEIFNDKEK
jgi:hypothetical protein